MSDIVSGAILGAAGIAGTVIGAINAGKNRKLMQSYLDKQKSENQAWYDSNYNTDITNRSDIQALMKNLRDNMKRDTQRSASTAAITGATPEMQTTVKENANKVITDTYSRIGAMGQAYKDGITDKYMAQKNALSGQQMGMYERSAQSNENLMSNSISGTLAGITGLISN